MKNNRSKHSNSTEDLRKLIKKTFSINKRELKNIEAFSLGQSILIFYHIHPDLFLSEILDRYLIEKALNMHEKQKIDKTWLKKAFSLNHDNYPKISPVYKKLHEHLPFDQLEQFIQFLDDQNISERIAERWEEKSPYHNELFRFYTNTLDIDYVCDTDEFYEWRKVGDIWISLSNTSHIYRNTFASLLRSIDIEPPKFFHIRNCSKKIKKLQSDNIDEFFCKPSDSGFCKKILKGLRKALNIIWKSLLEFLNAIKPDINI
ncbi:hypothetical protein [Candidatus Neptunichlamydia sp. REUL1]|uniref:hypothetical protein n=1 Tax=Candidatus Neptunichlamydia sp. REUL1 TaxID=3064277 RepID=UPI00292CAB07|nr:hypothetical protein [Candidatus Neptunochlamydia sp. REUL1]